VVDIGSALPPLQGSGKAKGAALSPHSTFGLSFRFHLSTKWEREGGSMEPERFWFNGAEALLCTFGACNRYSYRFTIMADRAIRSSRNSSRRSPRSAVLRKARQQSRTRMSGVWLSRLSAPSRIERPTGARGERRADPHIIKSGSTVIPIVHAR